MKFLTWSGVRRVSILRRPLSIAVCKACRSGPVCIRSDFVYPVSYILYRATTHDSNYSVSRSSFCLPGCVVHINVTIDRCGVSRAFVATP